MPVSSSAHVELIPWLLGWADSDADPELRKAFEVALHAGTAVALLVAWRHELRTLDRRAVVVIAVATLPAAVAGYALERPVERRLGTPTGIAGGLIAGALAMALADRAPQRRHYTDAHTADAAWIGLAQAAALFPGISRSGATLAAARARGFTRSDAHRLARHTGLPVIAGATGLKTLRLLQRHVDGDTRARLAAGGFGALLSTLAAAGPLVAATDARPLWPYSAYRAALAGAVARRRRGTTSGRCSTMVR